MGIIDWLFETKPTIEEVKKKRIFISFAIEDLKYRDYLVEQARLKKSSFSFIDMSAKKPWKQDEWKKRCRTKIKSSDGVIALISKNTHQAGGARWEIKCAVEENIPIIGMQIKWSNQGAKPKELKNKRVIRWSWDNIEKFINEI